MPVDVYSMLGLVADFCDYVSALSGSVTIDNFLNIWIMFWEHFLPQDSFYFLKVVFQTKAGIINSVTSIPAHSTIPRATKLNLYNLSVICYSAIKSFKNKSKFRYCVHEDIKSTVLSCLTCTHGVDRHHCTWTGFI